jgi:hypothetical protein
MLRLPLTPLSLRRLLDGDVGDLGAAEKLRGQSGRNLSVDLNDAWSVTDEAAFLRFIGPLIDGWHVQRCHTVHNKPTIKDEDWRCQNVERCGP